MSLGNRFSQHSFAQIPTTNQARSLFDRSSAAKTTFQVDDLVPIFLEEVLPGDTMKLNVSSFLRLATQAVPLMDNINFDYFFFFVPNRLVWSNWERFNGAQDDPDDSTDFIIPTLDLTGSQFEVGTIYDQFGLPTDVNLPGGTLRINSLPLRGYNLIYNEWFRDQNLQNSLTVPKGDGPDALNTFSIQKSNRAHDYFTSMLPWPQKGDAVALPLNGTATIQTDGNSLKVYNATSGMRELQLGGGNLVGYSGSSLGAVGAYYGSGLEVDLSSATAATINQLREAMMLQTILELDARGGTRYVEILRAHFNVISPDFRLQRPELLSSGRTKLQQHPVAQTSQTTEDSPQANLAAYSTQFENSGRIGFNKSFVEHGYVIGLIRARGDITYQQGLNKLWSRVHRFDFFWPKLQELGEQPVYNREWFLSGNAVTDGGVAGYQERFAEYRYKPSEIRGQFRSTYAESLDIWHLAEEFSSTPVLNGSYIKSNTPIERVLTVTEGYPHFLADFWFDLKHARPMVSYGVPASFGRF